MLLVNLGTPDAPTTSAVRRYLREFLMDARVVDIPYLARWALVHLVILPTRPQRSAAAYRTVWGADGSPLLAHGIALRDALAAALESDAGASIDAETDADVDTEFDTFSAGRPTAPSVRLAMRYGSPSIASALDAFAAEGVDRIVVVPLFPQYSAAAFGSAVERVFELAGARWNTPEISVVRPFFAAPGFIAASAAIAADALEAAGGVERFDHVLMSFHGVPERQCRRSDDTGAHCLVRSDCCAVRTQANRHCYRAQCIETADRLAAALSLPAGRWSVAFQSRLGRTPWIRPFTDEVLDELGRRGARNVAVLEPSFVADCLETIEEIGDRGRAIFQAAGGASLTLVPCLNADLRWVEALAGLVRPHLWVDGPSSPAGEAHGTATAAVMASASAATATIVASST